MPFSAPRSRPGPFTPSLLALALALALSLAGVGAQAEGLAALYEAARDYDAGYLSARATAEAAQYKAAQSDALVLPSAQLNATASRTDANTSSNNNTTLNNVGVTLDGSYTLYNRANQATMAQAQKLLALARTDLATAEQDLILRVAQAYFDVLAAQDTLAAARTGKTAISEQLASAKRNFEVGTATITDTREAQARFDLATARELVAENDLRTKQVVLDQLVGRSGVSPDGLATPVLLPPMVPATAEAWLDNAEQRHPLIQKAQLAQDVARLETEKARAGHSPTVNLVGQVGGNNSGGTAITDAFGRSGNNVNARIGVQLIMPLFTGFAVQNRIKETVVLEEKARNDLEAARRGVRLSTRSAFLGVQSLQAQVKALEAAESSTKLALEATQLGYKVGVRVNLDVLNAQSQLFDTQRDLAKARYDVLVTGLKLRQAAGQLQPSDLIAVQALLRR